MRLSTKGFLFACAASALLNCSSLANAETVLRYAASIEPPSLDPHASILAVAQQHGHLIYDTLFSRACDGSPKPQMVKDFKVEKGAAGAVWTMTLRDGLKFHDNTPVTSDDVIPSLKRWMSRDLIGRRLAQIGMEFGKVDDKTFTISMPIETPILLHALAKPRSVGAYIFRAKEAATPATESVTEYVGSGPFRFVRDEYVKGHKMVYEKNTDYVPRDEPSDCLAGGKIPKVDRVEWLVMPDNATAVAALQNGELDMFETPPLDLVPVLSANPDIDLKFQNLLGKMGYVRFNFTKPPFDKQDARKALIMMIDQADAMSVTAGGDPEYWRACYSYFGCGGRNESSSGNDWMRDASLQEAKMLLAQSGYKGEPIVFIAAGDDEIIQKMSVYTAEALRAGGLNVDLQLSDFGAMMAKRLNPDVWNIFVAWNPVQDLDDPLVNLALADACDLKTGYAGWSCSPEIIALKDQWVREAEPAARKVLAEKIAKEAGQLLPYGLLGQFRQPIAIRKEFTGVINAELPVMWNIERAAN